MEAELATMLELALQQGIWAVLYIYLFFRMLKENASRETQYQAMINGLSGSIQEGIEQIQDKLNRLTVGEKTRQSMVLQETDPEKYDH